MPYNPSVNDNSGQILAGYQISAADLALAQKQQQAEQFAKIGTAVTQFAAMQQGGKSFKKFMDVAGPSMGISPDDLKMFKGMNDMDAYQMSSMMLPMGPSMISANTWAPRAAMQNQNAVYQNQVPANQQPMAPLGTNSSANNAAPQPQSIFTNPNIKTADQFGR